MQKSLVVISLALVGALSGCGGGGGSSSGPAAGPSIPTVAAISLDATQQKSLEPLADGAMLSYQCDSGAAPVITMKHFGSVLGADTFAVTSPLPVNRAASSAGTAIFGNQSDGTLQYFGYVQGGVFTSVPTARKAEDPMPTIGTNYTVPEAGGGTVTTVFQNIIALTVPVATYSNAYAFHNTYSKNSNLTADFYDVRGVGTVRFDYTNGVAHDRCLLSATNLVAGS